MSIHSNDHMAIITLKKTGSQSWKINTDINKLYNFNHGGGLTEGDKDNICG
jgi:hypothetical protein